MGRSGWDCRRGCGGSKSTRPDESVCIKVCCERSHAVVVSSQMAVTWSLGFCSSSRSAGWIVVVIIAEMAAARILLLFSTGNNRMEVDGVVVSCLIIMHCNSDYSEVVYYLCIPGSHCGVPVTGQERRMI